ncbi:MAG: N-acyl-D-aspartate/D-glutamate deacylase, partial [Candidatus Azotimanducaceae bacterium]
TCYHGVFAPNSTLRARIVPGKPRKNRTTQHAASNLTNRPSEPQPAELTQLTWAQRLKRAFEFDVTVCPCVVELCGGTLRVIADITDPNHRQNSLPHSTITRAAGASAKARPRSFECSTRVPHTFSSASKWRLQFLSVKMTSAQARVIGFTDRGTRHPGIRADINVIDIAEVCELQPQLVHDFPHGAPQLIQNARGYKATVCNGQVILENDEHTGTRAGEILRST